MSSGREWLFERFCRRRLWTGVLHHIRMITWRGICLELAGEWLVIGSGLDSGTGHLAPSSRDGKNRRNRFASPSRTDHYRFGIIDRHKLSANI